MGSMELMKNRNRRGNLFIEVTSLPARMIEPVKRFSLCDCARLQFSGSGAVRINPAPCDVVPRCLSLSSHFEECGKKNNIFNEAWASRKVCGKDSYGYLSSRSRSTMAALMESTWVNSPSQYTENREYSSTLWHWLNEEVRCIFYFIVIRNSAVLCLTLLTKHLADSHWKL